MPDPAIHSDFLIHWTGVDLDREYDPAWSEEPGSKIKGKPGLVSAYAERLRSILKHGLWVTAEPEWRLVIGGSEVVVPESSRVCFTELKLSLSRKHAQRYGRLGIGVKRPYVFERLGRAMAYVCYDFKRQKDPLLEACARDLMDPTLLNFFKPMNSSSTLNYDLYDESEWRIVFRKALLRRGFLVDPRNPLNREEHAFFGSLTPEQQAKLRYLAPLDGWLGLIIYPSLSVKNESQDATHGIRSELKAIKDRDDHGNRVEGHSWPIEMNLDACRNF